MLHKRSLAAACLFVFGALGGCALTGGAGSDAKNPPPPQPEGQPKASGTVEPLLEMMSALPQGDPARQAELFQSAKDAASLSPTTTNRLEICPRAGHSRATAAPIPSPPSDSWRNC